MCITFKIEKKLRLNSCFRCFSKNVDLTIFLKEHSLYFHMYLLQSLSYRIKNISNLTCFILHYLFIIKLLLYFIEKNLYIYVYEKYNTYLNFC